MRLIDADELFEKTAEWEASAFAYIEELNRIPLEEMDEDEKAEWRRWTAIWGERSAFKHDVADAPTIDPVKWIPVTEGLPEEGKDVLVCDAYGFIYTAECEVISDDEWLDWQWYESVEYMPKDDVVAWMPLPEPWEGEEG